MLRAQHVSNNVSRLEPSICCSISAKGSIGCLTSTHCSIEGIVQCGVMNLASFLIRYAKIENVNYNNQPT